MMNEPNHKIKNKPTKIIPIVTFQLYATNVIKATINKITNDHVNTSEASGKSLSITTANTIPSAISIII